MELRMPTPDELRRSYQKDLSEAFPPQELKPLKHIINMTERGLYYPLCLYDGGEIVGECFLWAGRPGWLLLDYLCVTRTRRNAGLGAYLLDAMRQRWPDSAIIGETEVPEYAPNPPIAARRLGFYRRNGAASTGIQADIFGVRYQIICWSAAPRPDAEIQSEYENIYRSSFPPDKYERYIKIPRRASDAPTPVPWEA